MKKEDQILIKLTRIETKLDDHLNEHQKKFDLVTKFVIPGTSLLTSLATLAFGHYFSPKH